MDFKRHIPHIEKKIGYTFKDKGLLIQSFTRSSFCNEKNRGGRADYISNEVLEFFGDSVLSTAIISILLDSKTARCAHGIKTELTEGDFSNIRSKLSDKSNLSRSTAELGLQKYLILGEGDAKLGVADEPSVMEDLFESIIGAVYIDCGRDIETVIKVVSGMLDTSVYLTEGAVIQSHKNALQEWCADKKHRLPAPVYRTLGESGPDHKKVYERGVFIGERLCGTGSGKNQKIADSAAAEAALRLLMSEATAKASPATTEALASLKALASAKKQPSPEFRDLGETPSSNQYEREYIIECRFMGHTESGIGKSKQEARCAAAEKMLSALKPQNAKHPEKKKNAPSERQGTAIGGRSAKAAGASKLQKPAAKPKRAPHYHKKRS